MRLPHDARVRHAIERHVVNESGRAEQLAGQIDARGVAADNGVVRAWLRRRGSGGLARQTNRRRKRPIIPRRLRALAQNSTVAHREFGHRAAKTPPGLFKKKRAHLRASRAERDAAGLHRLTARRIALVGSAVGVAGVNDYPLDRHIEFFGGDLRHRREHALAELDASGRKPDASGRGKIEPAIEARIIGKHGRQSHARLPSRKRAAAFSTARRNAFMRAAPAQIVVECAGDFRARRRRVAVKERLGRDQNAA
jgi:hypothetical protein